jgi:hypothetical protein
VSRCRSTPPYGAGAGKVVGVLDGTRMTRRWWAGGQPAVVLAVAASVLLASCAAAPAGSVPIGPHEHFRGLVNGSGSDVVITTVCGGPVWEGRTGPVLAGQTLTVVRDDAGPGDTGSSSIVFAQPTPASMAVVSIGTYDTPMPFPADVQVPCDGTGTVAFTPCFGVAGCLGDARADLVKVRFVNIAD